jgi:hypothetical protein
LIFDAKVRFFSDVGKFMEFDGTDWKKLERKIVYNQPPYIIFIIKERANFNIYINFK